MCQQPPSLPCRIILSRSACVCLFQGISPAPRTAAPAHTVAFAGAGRRGLPQRRPTGTGVWVRRQHNCNVARLAHTNSWGITGSTPSSSPTIAGSRHCTSNAICTTAHNIAQQLPGPRSRPRLPPTRTGTVTRRLLVLMPRQTPAPRTIPVPPHAHALHPRTPARNRCPSGSTAATPSAILFSDALQGFPTFYAHTCQLSLQRYPHSAGYPQMHCTRASSSCPRPCPVANSSSSGIRARLIPLLCPYGKDAAPPRPRLRARLDAPARSHRPLLCLTGKDAAPPRPGLLGTPLLLRYSVLNLPSPPSSPAPATPRVHRVHTPRAHSTPSAFRRVCVPHARTYCTQASDPCPVAAGPSR